MTDEAETFDLQTIVILSYRREYRLVHHGNWHASAKNSSEVKLRTTWGPKRAAEFIASQLAEDPYAEFSHLLFLSWDAMTNFAAHEDFPGGQKAGNPYGGGGWNEHGPVIHMPYDVDYDAENWEEQEEELEITQKIHREITEHVGQILGKIKPDWTKGRC